MDIAEGLDMGRDAMIMVLIVASPVMLSGMLVGLIISLFQSMTQLQEQTLSFVPKIVAMVGIGIALAPWLASQLLEYAREMFAEPPF